MAIKIKKEVLEAKLYRLEICLELHGVPRELITEVGVYYTRYLQGDTVMSAQDVEILPYKPGWSACRDRSLDKTTSEFLLYLDRRNLVRFQRPEEELALFPDNKPAPWTAWLRCADVINPRDCEAWLDDYRDATGQQLSLKIIKAYIENYKKGSNWADSYDYMYPVYSAILGKYAKYRRDLEILFDCGGKLADLQGLRYVHYDLPEHLEAWQIDCCPQYPYTEEASIKQLIAYRYGLVDRNWCYSYPGLKAIAEDLEAPYSFILNILEEISERTRDEELWLRYESTKGIPILTKYR